MCWKNEVMGLDSVLFFLFINCVFILALLIVRL